MLDRIFPFKLPCGVYMGILYFIFRPKSYCWMIYQYHIYIFFFPGIPRIYPILSLLIHPRETPHVRPLAQRVHGTWRRVPSPCGRAWSSMWRMVSFWIGPSDGRSIWGSAKMCAAFIVAGNMGTSPKSWKIRKNEGFELGRSFTNGGFSILPCMITGV